MNLKPVGKWFSTWVARARASRQLLLIVFFGITAVSTFTNVARDYLTFTQMIVVDSLFLVGLIAFMYLGDILGFFRSQQRDLREMQNNFLNPQGAALQLIRAEQFKVLGEFLNGGLGKKKFDEKMDEITKQKIKEHRGEIDMDEVTGGAGK